MTPKGVCKSISPAPRRSCRCLQRMLLTELQFVPSPLLTQWKHPKAFPSPCWHLAKYHESRIALRFQKTHQLQTKTNKGAETQGTSHLQDYGPYKRPRQPTAQVRVASDISSASYKVADNLLCQLEQPNAFIQPRTWRRKQGLQEAKERSQKMARSCLPSLGKTPSLGTFHAAQGTGQSQICPSKTGPATNRQIKRPDMDGRT